MRTPTLFLSITSLFITELLLFLLSFIFSCFSPPPLIPSLPIHFCSFISFKLHTPFAHTHTDNAAKDLGHQLTDSPSPTRDTCPARSSHTDAALHVFSSHRREEAWAGWMTHRFDWHIASRQKSQSLFSSYTDHSQCSRFSSPHSLASYFQQIMNSFHLLFPSLFSQPSVIHSLLLSDWMLSFTLIHTLALHAPFLPSFSLTPPPSLLSLLRQVHDRTVPLERSLSHLFIIATNDG